MKLNQTYIILRTSQDVKNFTQDLLCNGYAFHHSALAYGYVGKEYAALYAEYSGMFGRGITIHYPTDKTCKSTSNRRIEYYILEE